MDKVEFKRLISELSRIEITENLLSRANELLEDNNMHDLELLLNRIIEYDGFDNEGEQMNALYGIDELPQVSSEPLVSKLKRKYNEIFETTFDREMAQIDYERRRQRQIQEELERKRQEEENERIRQEMENQMEKQRQVDKKISDLLREGRTLRVQIRDTLGEIIDIDGISPNFTFDDLSNLLTYKHPKQRMRLIFNQHQYADNSFVSVGISNPDQVYVIQLAFRLAGLGPTPYPVVLPISPLDFPGVRINGNPIPNQVNVPAIVDVTTGIYPCIENTNIPTTSDVLQQVYDIHLVSPNVNIRDVVRTVLLLNGYRMDDQHPGWFLPNRADTILRHLFQQPQQAQVRHHEGLIDIDEKEASQYFPTSPLAIVEPIRTLHIGTTPHRWIELAFALQATGTDPDIHRAIKEIANSGKVDEILDSMQVHGPETVLARWKSVMLHAYYFYHIDSPDHRVKPEEREIMTSSRMYGLVHWLVQTHNSPLRLLFANCSIERKLKFDRIVSLLEAIPDTFKPVVMQQILNNIFISYAPVGVSLLNWTPEMGSSCGDGSIDYMLLECGHVFQGVFGIPQQYDPDQKIEGQIEVKKSTEETVLDWLQEFQTLLEIEFGPNGLQPNASVFERAETEEQKSNRRILFQQFWNKKLTENPLIAEDVEEFRRNASEIQAEFFRSALYEGRKRRRTKTSKKQMKRKHSKK